MAENAKIKEIAIICANRACREAFSSPIFFGDVQSFESSLTWGNKAQCPRCGQLTDCNKENMFYTLA
jgi:hypothetical protein